MASLTLWQQTATLPTFPALNEDTTAAAVIVGGGLCGLLTAYRLREVGITDVAVLEADTLCGGATARTTGKITAQQGTLYRTLYRHQGESQTRAYADAALRAVASFEELAAAVAPDCDFTVCESVLYAQTPAEADRLLEEQHILQRLGLETRLSPDTELPFPVRQALWLPRQARFHPLRFAAGLITWLHERGVRFYEHTPVLYPASRDGTLITPSGTVSADTVFLTTHYPLADRRGLYFARLRQRRSYLMSFKNVPPLTHMYLGLAPGSWSLRSFDRQILLGFGSHPTGEETDLPHGPLAQTVSDEWYPGRQITAVWANQDVMTPDGVPRIGHYPAVEPRLAKRVFLATGFNAWGMTGSMVAAGVLSRLATGQEWEQDRVFSTQRFRRGQAGALLKENGRVLVQYLGGWLSLPPHTAHLLPPGEGGVFRIDGQRVGLYKDPDGGLHAVRPICPHLGCPLRFNREEKTWDCPCHGSRFDPDGNLLNTPAMRPLTPRTPPCV